jgi:predicted ATPase
MRPNFTSVGGYDGTHFTSARRTTALQGMGGIGKSVTATAFAHACATRRSFGDGIVWVRLGEEPDLVRVLRSVGEALGDKRSRALSGIEDRRE